MSIFPKSFYNNNLTKNEVREVQKVQKLTDIKQDLNTGEFILDSKGDFIILKDLEALIQINKRKLSTPKGKYIIYSKDFGSNVYKLNGQTKNVLDIYAEEFIIKALVDDKYTLGITDIEIKREEQGYYTVSFLVNTIYGQYAESTNMEAIV